MAMHSTTHDYRHVYESYDSFKEEVDVLSNYLTELTGFTPFAFRFPGGSSNQQTTLPIQTFIKYLDEKISYITTGMFHREMAEVKN